MQERRSAAVGSELLAPEDPRWLALLDRTASDVYHQPGYLRACAEAEEGLLRVALVEAAGATMGVPLLLRPLPGGEGGFDASSPYGYPSPLATAGSSEQWRALWLALRRLLAEQGVISAFFRLHPLLSDQASRDGAAGIGTLVEHGACVHLDLDQPEEALWAETRQRFRSNINALRREGWRFVADDWSHFPAFLEIYEATMQRAEASSFYLFSPSYYRALREGLGEAALLHSVLDPDGRPATAAIFLRHGGIVQYHLGGTAAKSLASAPAKLLFHEASLWHRRQGARILHLGGGFGGQADSLFRFKSGFSKRSSPFFTLRLVIEPGRYDALTRAWQRRAQALPPGPEGFFPAYRAAIPTGADVLA